MIDEVYKFLFFGLESQKEDFFRQAQQVGIIEFIHQGAHPTSHDFTVEEACMVSAMKRLRPLSEVEQDPEDNPQHGYQMAQRAVKLGAIIEQGHEMKQQLHHELSRVDPLGDFSLPELKELEAQTGHSFSFWVGPSAALETRDEGLIFVNRFEDHDYFLAADDKNYEGLRRFDFTQSPPQIRSQLARIENDLEQAEVELKNLGRYFDQISKALIHSMNDSNRSRALGASSPEVGERCFFVEGWVAKGRLKELDSFLKQTGIFSEQVQIEEEDHMPTHIENKGLAHSGQDLVEIYDIPGPLDRDPSAWVLAAFSLFFAMIIGDGGYGLLFLATTLYLKYKYQPKAGIGKRLLRLGTLLSCTCIAWGLLSHSFFGITVGPESNLRKSSLIHHLAKAKASYHFQKKDAVYKEAVTKFPQLANLNDGQAILEGGVRVFEGKQIYDLENAYSDNVLKELALIIGIIHLSFSLLRYLDRNWSGIGWVIFMFGSYLFFPKILDATTLAHYYLGLDRASGFIVGEQMVYFGIALSVVLAVIQHKLYGLLEIMNLIQVFSDVLSYLRIYALGLSGAMVSSTFNDMAMLFSWPIAILILLVGHSVNIALSIMSGVIHGLRLNFLEWYHYSFEGGGKLHKPLALLTFK